MTGFVIVVDMQRDFVMANGALPVPDAEAIVAPMQKWLAGLNPAEVAGVLMTFDTHVRDIYAVSAEAEQFPLHCEKGTAGWGSMLDISSIDPAIPVYTLEKGVFDMWAEPELIMCRLNGDGAMDRDAFFDQLAASDVQEVSVVGVAADYCVRWAVEGLVRRGFAVGIPLALTRGISMTAQAVFHDAQQVSLKN